MHVVYLHTRMSGPQFGAASGAEQVIDYRATLLGMVNVQTRLWNDHLWTRITESILPNCNQTGAIWEAADSTKVFQRSAMLRWMVPQDDRRTLTIGWRYFRPELDPTRQGDPARVGRGKIDFIGQTADERPYEERQRAPGDYEVQVSQREIAVHALENLASSDRGVAMLRRLIRTGIRETAAKAGPGSLPTGEDDLIGTYCQDTVWPRAVGIADLGPDELAEFGTAVIDSLMETSGQSAQNRRARLEYLLAQRYR